MTCHPTKGSGGGVTRAFDRMTATFRPQRTDDLKPGAETWIGRTVEWEACWKIEEGQFAGDWAWRPLVDDTPPFAWVPGCDLVGIA